MLPAMKEKAPSVAKDLESVVRNLAVLTQEFKVVLPALAAVAPDLPHASRRAVEALDEAVVLIKAMQKSMFMRGSVQEVREEEETPRKPASKDK
jgi:phospholipid/cholesterol/gamma-HCH transport system substrate-binding protein